MAQLISPQTGLSSSIYDPTLPNRIAQGAPVPQQPPGASIDPGQGLQYNPSFGMDASPTRPPSSEPLGPLTYLASFPITGDYSPSPLGTALGAASAKGAPYSTRRAANAGSNFNVDDIFNNLSDDIFTDAGAGKAAPATQAPASATPQGWNLFTALGQALGHLLGYNASGQPQGMSGLVRNPVQAAPSQTAALRMLSPVASRYQGRTLVG